ncbi:MAG: glutathione S-transferase C-terminal domain-containing protein [Rubrivivax sp.]|nr:glutathione S-transferase C-terminal domain-containing protein [Rubrivivax sp.]
MEWLNFITSELHKGFSALFNPATPEDHEQLARTPLDQRFARVDQQLEGRDYLTGATFTVADANLFTVAGWGRCVGVDIAPLKNLSAFSLAGRAGPLARPFARHGQSTGLSVSRLSPSAPLPAVPACKPLAALRTAPRPRLPRPPRRCSSPSRGATSRAPAPGRG